MKKLYLLRHAKSSWEDMTLDDFERPLNQRGQKDAPFIATILAKKQLQFDIIISSPSTRTKQTLQFIKPILAPLIEVMYDEAIYEATLDGLENVIKNLENSVDNLLFVGHNPSLNNFVEKYIYMDENIPTCGVVGIEFQCETWEQIAPQNAKKIFFEYPKLYKNR